MFIKIVIRSVLFLVLAVSPLTRAGIISSFDVDTTLTISADFDITDLDTFFDDEFLSQTGAGTGAVSGSGDDLFDLVSGATTTLDAFADGSIAGSPGSVEGYYLSSGEFLFENTGDDSFTGRVIFDFDLFASIFTDSVEESALALSSIFVGFKRYDSVGKLLAEGDIVDEFLEFDSSLDDVGVGVFSDSISDSTTSDFTIGIDESILYYFELDASGVADSTRATTVSEPTTFAIFAMAMMCFGIRQFGNKIE
jgi:hypothetical protein